LVSGRTIKQDGPVATTQPKPASRRLLDAAAAERLALEDDLAALEERRQTLHGELRSLEIAERELRHRLALVSELAGSHEARPLRGVGVSENGRSLEVLRGAAIRRTAGRIVAASADPLRPRHYTDWFQELLEAGYSVGGRDPLAAFLTQLNRSPVVTREAHAGTYRIDYDVIPTLERQLLKLHSELTQLHRGQQTIEGIASVRDRRDELTHAIEQVERTLAEAIATLHPA
jgi:hypothetical protein